MQELRCFTAVVTRHSTGCGKVLFVIFYKLKSRYTSTFGVNPKIGKVDLQHQHQIKITSSKGKIDFELLFVKFNFFEKSKRQTN